ncbi:hypothetical protein MD484_g5348, partial [Candolleomyces efflorescens]
MPPKVKKASDLLARLASLFISRGGEAPGTSQSDYPPAPPAPDFSHPEHSSTLQRPETQTQNHPSNSDNETVVTEPSITVSNEFEAPLSSSAPPPQQSYDCSSPSGFESHNGTASFFSGASAFQVNELKVVNMNSPDDKSIDDGWELLSDKIAPNALQDSMARYDAPKCDEDTRVEVVGEIMEWIQDCNHPQRLLCMTGAAGSGKSALQGTIAERCAQSDIPFAAFFFSSTDSTRNTISSIVPTIAYQIGLKHDPFRRSVAAAVKHDHHIFSRSLKSQMDALIVRPFECLQRSIQIGSTPLPYTILIDGLDECIGALHSPGATDWRLDNDQRRRGEDQQDELLTTIKSRILDKHLPFHIFIASRPELAIHTALEPGGCLHGLAYHIRLSDQYDASADMRRYLRRRFDAIGLRIRNPGWFTEADIEMLVRAGSGQFVYVATVWRYVSQPRGSPAERLKIVLTWKPHEEQVTRPFAAIDELYTGILLAAKAAYEAVDSHHGRDFLLLLKAQHIVAGGMDKNTSLCYYVWNPGPMKL